MDPFPVRRTTRSSKPYLEPLQERFEDLTDMVCGFLSTTGKRKVAKAVLLQLGLNQ